MAFDPKQEKRTLDLLKSLLEGELGESVQSIVNAAIARRSAKDRCRQAERESNDILEKYAVARVALLKKRLGEAGEAVCTICGNTEVAHLIQPLFTAANVVPSQGEPYLTECKIHSVCRDCCKDQLKRSGQLVPSRKEGVRYAQPLAFIVVGESDNWKMDEFGELKPLPDNTEIVELTDVTAQLAEKFEIPPGIGQFSSEHDNLCIGDDQLPVELIASLAKIAEPSPHPLEAAIGPILGRVLQDDLAVSTSDLATNSLALAGDILKKLKKMDDLVGNANPMDRHQLAILTKAFTGLANKLKEA